jgi:hypothetical protein
LGQVRDSRTARRQAGAQLDGPLQHFLGPRGITPTKQDLAEPSIDPVVARRLLSGRHKSGLRLREQVRLDVHPRDGDEHVHIAPVPPLGRAPDLAREGPAGGVAKRIAESDGGRGARVVLPALYELVDRVSH